MQYVLTTSLYAHLSFAKEMDHNKKHSFPLSTSFALKKIPSNHIYYMRREPIKTSRDNPCLAAYMLAAAAAAAVVIFPWSKCLLFC